jgi:hypothetical protein
VVSPNGRDFLIGQSRYHLIRKNIAVDDIARAHDQLATQLACATNGGVDHCKIGVEIANDCQSQVLLASTPAAADLRRDLNTNCWCAVLGDFRIAAILYLFLFALAL